MNDCKQKRLKIFFFIFSILIHIFLKPMESPGDKSALPVEETSLTSPSGQQHKELSEIPDKNLTALYAGNAWKLNFYIPEHFNSISDLKEIFDKYHLSSDVTSSGYLREYPYSWTQEHWEKVYSVLKRRLEDTPSWSIPIQKLSELLEDAKLILKSFLPDDYSVYSDPNFIKKSGALNRIFTYSKLGRIIEEKQLLHIHLPLKYIGIREKATGKFLDKETASKILDKIIKLSVTVNLSGPKHDDPDELLLDEILALYATIVALFQDYELWVFAQKQPKPNTKLSAITFRELQTLVSEAPFDVGFDNIFSDSNGDAIIIDTEFKEDFPATSLAKLSRYRP